MLVFPNEAFSYEQDYGCELIELSVESPVGYSLYTYATRDRKEYAFVYAEHYTSQDGPMTSCWEAIVLEVEPEPDPGALSATYTTYQTMDELFQNGAKADIQKVIHDPLSHVSIISPQLTY